MISQNKNPLYKAIMMTIILITPFLIFFYPIISYTISFSSIIQSIVFILVIATAIILQFFLFYVLFELINLNLIEIIIVIASIISIPVLLTIRYPNIFGVVNSNIEKIMVGVIYSLICNFIIMILSLALRDGISTRGDEE